VSILDDLQPAIRRPRPTEVSLEGADLRIAWDDGVSHLTPLVMLRARCPCAGCVDEWTGKRLLNVTTIKPDVRPLALTEVGRYAVQVGWSDGHQTGIYSWDLLRRLAEEHAGRAA
jgi:DUF971 family protein